jgi:diaminopimelate epimerase
MRLRFTKMHSLGNDFLVIDGISQEIILTSEQVVRWANRHTGIGFDQCLVIEESSDPAIDFYYKIYNADGSEVGQCGNGARCLAKFVQFYGLTDKKTLQVSTRTTTFSLNIQGKEVTVRLSPAQFSPAQIPINFTVQQQSYAIDLPQDQVCHVHALSVGNPHAVLRVDEVEKAPVRELGKLLSEHTFFPQQTNVEFMEIIGSELIKLRVYERGCGETQACGSGAVAAAVVARKFYGVDARIRVLLPGGELMVHCPNPDAEIELTGPAEFVYEGVLL